MKSGFTLIELSIVLVIIGLIIGGILTGQDLLNAAAIRAQISQIEHYNTAVRTFQGKYGYLPGDIPNPYATRFGFKTRGQYEGTGNGNGIISGSYGDASAFTYPLGEGAGETVMFWVDLSTANLIDSNLNTATSYTLSGSDITGAAIGKYLPQAKIGQGNYVYVYPTASWAASPGWAATSPNYFGISAVTIIASSSSFGELNSTPGMTVQQAYNIDAKMDDGLPQSGGVTTVYDENNYGVFWTDGTNITFNNSPPSTVAIGGSATTCMDNGGVAGVKHYSTEENGGGGMNCALSFGMQ